MLGERQVNVKCLQDFSVSPRPLGFWFFSFWVLGLRVWGQGLTIVKSCGVGCPADFKDSPQSKSGLSHFGFNSKVIYGLVWT